MLDGELKWEHRLDCWKRAKKRIWAKIRLDCWQRVKEGMWAKAIYRSIRILRIIFFKISDL